ncbi:MAG: hypothetical protein ACKV0T_04520, partial [Planctomycetales bacterium]
PVAGKPGTATLQGRLVLYNFRNEQLTLPIPLESVPITAASLNGQSAPLVTIDGAAGKELAVVLPSRGAHLLDVTITLPVEQAGHSGKVLLPLKPAPAGALRFTLPAADLTLKVEGGAGAFRRLQEGDKRVAIVPIDRGGPVTLNWAPAQAREGGEEIVHVESTTALQFTDAGMRIDASFQFVVRQGTLSEGLFGLPPGLLVRQIAGPDLGGWEITGEGEQRSLKVFLRRPVNDATTLRFDLFQALSIGDQPLPVGVPQFEPRGLTREVGTLGVSAERQLVVSAGPLTGLSQIDAAQFSKAGAQAAPPLLAYRFSARPFQLQLLVARQKPVSKGTSEHACYVGLRKQRLVSRLKLQLVGAPRSEIVVQLPPDYLLYDLKSLDASDYYVETPNDAPGPVLHIDLAAPRTGTIELVLDGIVPRQPEDLLPILSVPEPLGVGEMRSALAVWLDRSYAATIQSFDGWKTVDPETLPANLKGARQGPVQLAFTSSLTSLQPIALELKRAQARLGGEAVTVLLVRGTSVQYSIYLKWQISLAGEGTFVFTVPDWLANRMEIDRNLPGVRIRDVTSEKIAGNRVRLTVALEDPRDTGLLLAAHAVLPPPEDARIAAPTITFERIVTDESGRRIVPLESQRQFLVLVNQSQGRLDREGAAGSAVEAIPAQELPIRVGDEISNQAAEILAVRDPRATTTWTLQSTAALKALPASVNLAKLTLVLARDGSWRGEAAYRVNNRSRQFLALRMPAGARVLSLHVAGQAARPISPGRAADPGVLLVPLPKLSEGDQAVEIKLVSAGRFGNSLPQGLQVLRSELDLPAPQVLSQADDPDFGAPVAATEWTVVLPPDLDAKRIDDPDRTNVSESTEGAEELISWYQELLRLREEARRVGVRNNLAQLGTTVDNISQLESKVAAFDRKGYALQDERQARQVAELKQQWQSSANKSAGKVPSPATVQSKPDNPLSQKQVQGEIIRFNSDSFVSGGESDREYELRLELAEKPAETATAQTSPVPQKAAGKGTANRRALKGQTATQSLELNYANAAPQGAQTDEYWEEERYSKSPATDPLVSDSSGSRARNAGDADEILNADNGNNLRGIRAQGGGGFGFPVVQGRMGGASRGGGFGGGLGGGGQGGGGMGGGEPAQEGQGKGRANGPPQQPAAGGNRQRGGGRNEAGQADDFVLGSGQGSVWSQTGGLSLELTLPQEGQKLTFSKPGGDAKLALGLRPRVSQGVGMGLVWTIIWLALAVGAVRALGQSRRWERLQQWLPLSVTLLGLVWYFGLPGHTMGFLVFACGLVRLAWPRRSATT